MVIYCKSIIHLEHVEFIRTNRKYLRALASKNQTKGGRPKKMDFIHTFSMNEPLAKMNKHGDYFAFRALLPWLQSNIDFTLFLGYFQFLKAENWQKSKFHYM